MGLIGSINTNNGASIALQNLNATALALGQTQTRINTGKKIDSARDNGAVWAISKNQSSDQTAYNAVTDSIQRGQTTAEVALTAAANLTDTLSQMKQKALAASESNISDESRLFLNAEYVALRNTIATTINSAEINGINLLKNQSVQALSDLRSQQTLTVGGIDLSFATITGGGGGLSYTYIPLADATHGYMYPGPINPPYNEFPSFPGYVYEVRFPGILSTSITASFGKPTDPNADAITFSNSDGSVVVPGIRSQLLTGVIPEFIFSDGLADPAVLFPSLFGSVGSGTTSTGIMQIAEGSNLVNATVAAAEYVKLDKTLKNLTTAVGKMGAQARRLDTYSTLVTKQQDTIETGIGNLVDADLAKESAKFIALQTKQQLGTQAMAIASQSTVYLQTLFRQ